MKARFLIPVVVFAVLAVFLAIGLSLDPKKLPSPLIGKPIPQFTLSRLKDPHATLGSKDLQGKVSLLNVWATWCVSCRAEHELLMALGRRDGVNLYGLNYKDNRADALRWLQVYGNPYRANAFDADGRVGIDWGVYGTPETFIIDKQGIVRHKVIGPITVDVLNGRLLPLIEQLEAAS